MSNNVGESDSSKFLVQRINFGKLRHMSPFGFGFTLVPCISLIAGNLTIQCYSHHFRPKRFHVYFIIPTVRYIPTFTAFPVTANKEPLRLAKKLARNHSTRQCFHLFLCWMRRSRISLSQVYSSGALSAQRLEVFATERRAVYDI